MLMTQRDEPGCTLTSPAPCQGGMWEEPKLDPEQRANANVLAFPRVFFSTFASFDVPDRRHLVLGHS